MKRLTPIGTAAMTLFPSGRGPMKHLATVALMLVLSVAAAYAHDESVKMTFSGTSDTSATNLQQPDTSNDGDNFAGEGTLGSFTVRNVRAIANSPTASSSCSGANQLYLLELAGAAVFLCGAVLSVHHYAIAACMVGGAASYFAGKKLRAAASSAGAATGAAA